MKTVGFLSSALHSGGGCESFQLIIAEGLAQRGWQILNAYERDGDLLARWNEFADVAQMPVSPATDPTAAAKHLEGCNIVYVHSPHLFTAGLQVGRMLQAPMVAHLHFPPFHLRKGIKGLLVGRHRGKMDPEVYSKRTQIARFIAVSQHTANLWALSGIPRKRLAVVHNGVDTTLYIPGSTAEREQIRNELHLEPDAVVVGYVGRIDRSKGVEQLLDAFGSVSSRCPQSLSLVVIGGPTGSLGAEGGRLVEELKERAIGDVRWLGKRSDVPRLYRAMDIAVVPSQWDEPFGLVAAEALASQVAVIATRRGGLPEIFQSPLDANLVGPTAPEIAARLLELVEDCDLRERFGSQGRRLIEERFTTERTIDQIESHLSDLL